MLQRSAACVVLAALAATFSFREGSAADEPSSKKLAQGAAVFLTKYCSDCHSGKEPKSGVDDFDLLSYDSLTKKRTEEGETFHYVRPGKAGDKNLLKDSRLWNRAGIKKVAGAMGDMPPKKAKNKPTGGVLRLSHGEASGAT